MMRVGSLPAIQATTLASLVLPEVQPVIWKLSSMTWTFAMAPNCDCSQLRAAPMPAVELDWLEQLLRVPNPTRVVTLDPTRVGSTIPTESVRSGSSDIGAPPVPPVPPEPVPAVPPEPAVAGCATGSARAAAAAPAAAAARRARIGIAGTGAARAIVSDLPARKQGTQAHQRPSAHSRYSFPPCCLRSIGSGRSLRRLLQVLEQSVQLRLGFGHRVILLRRALAILHVEVHAEVCRFAIADEGGLGLTALIVEGRIVQRAILADVQIRAA